MTLCFGPNASNTHVSIGEKRGKLGESLLQGRGLQQEVRYFRYHRYTVPREAFRVPIVPPGALTGGPGS